MAVYKSPNLLYRLREVTLQTMLMKTLLKVATKYKTVLMTNAFPSAFLDPLIKMSSVEDAAIRKIVQDILHTLLDRHDNKRKLRMVRYVGFVYWQILTNWNIKGHRANRSSVSWYGIAKFFVKHSGHSTDMILVEKGRRV